MKLLLIVVCFVQIIYSSVIYGNWSLHTLENNSFIIDHPRMVGKFELSNTFFSFWPCDKYTKENEGIIK